MKWLRAGLAAVVAVLLYPAAAHAAWVKAETDRFVVYGDVPEKTVRDYAVKLNTFDQILHIYNPKIENKPPPRKFEVYLVRQWSTMRRIRPDLPGAVAGFYTAEPQAQVAVAWVGQNVLGGDTVLFHEYAHYFMLANFPAAYPTWFTEGWAEYFGATEITGDWVRVGGYNQNRVDWLLYASWMSWDDLLGKKPGELRQTERPLYYPQSWLFVHYMMSSRERVQQLNKITAAIAAGEEPVKAVRAATGMDMSALNRALKAYTKLSINVFKDFHPEVQVEVSRLPPVADELLLDKLRLAFSDVTKPDPGFLAAVRRNAAKYAGEPLADHVQALAEFTYGDIAAGEAIVNGRLAAKPNEVETLRIAGVGEILAGEREPSNRLARFRAARAHLVKAYSLDKADFRILSAYAFSRTAEPAFPNDNDVNALLEAHGLAPAAEDISLWAGAALMKRGRREEGARLLSIVANAPHGGKTAELARAVALGGDLDLKMVQISGEDGDDEPKSPPKPDPKGKSGSGTKP